MMSVDECMQARIKHACLFYLTRWLCVRLSLFLTQLTLLNLNRIKRQLLRNFSWAVTAEAAAAYILISVTRTKSPNVYKSCPKMISLEKWYELLPKASKSCPKSNKSPNLVTLLANKKVISSIKIIVLNRCTSIKKWRFPASFSLFSSFQYSWQ